MTETTTARYIEPTSSSSSSLYSSALWPWLVCAPCSGRGELLEHWRVRQTGQWRCVRSVAPFQHALPSGASLHTVYSIFEKAQAKKKNNLQFCMKSTSRKKKERKLCSIQVWKAVKWNNYEHLCVSGTDRKIKKTILQDWYMSGSYRSLCEGQWQLQMNPFARSWKCAVLCVKDRQIQSAILQDACVKGTCRSQENKKRNLQDPCWNHLQISTWKSQAD